ncbi:MAG: hypothetical protein OZ917_00615 [Candidatus Brocadiaceae bacterium]|nr:hypothetical protein [Candidatus Brocadiaceae bacterium]
MWSIKDNVSLLDEETINKINEVVLRAGHKLVKKDGELHGKADTKYSDKVFSFVISKIRVWNCFFVVSQLKLGC